MSSENPMFESGGRHFREEFLEELALELVLETTTVEQVLSEGTPAEQAALRELFASEDFVIRVDGLRSWVGGTRAQLEEWKGADDTVAKYLVPEILSSCTRSGEDGSTSEYGAPLSSGVWGDAKVLFGFMRRRMASSVALRLAAASLLAHLIALPALAAYIYWQRPAAEPLTLRFDPAQPIDLEELQEQAPDEILDVDSDLWSALGLDEANAIAEARYRIGHGDWTHSLAGLDEPWAGWVAVRLQRLNSGSQVKPIAVPPAGLSASLAHVLAMDLALDDWLLGRRAAGLGEVWFHPLLELVSGSGGRSDSTVLLATAALQRAHAYGLLGTSDLPGAVRERLGAKGLDLPVLGPWWFEQLRAKGMDLQGDIPAWNAWLQDLR